MAKTYDLEERTYLFALNVRLFIKKIPKTIANIEDGKQVIRSSGSVGANYIEANEKVGEKDLRFRLKIARKEAKETIYWLRLILNSNEKIDKEENELLIKEALELRNILSAIINKLK
jgi:four helix bundle protein